MKRAAGKAFAVEECLHSHRGQLQYGDEIPGWYTPERKQIQYQYKGRVGHHIHKDYSQKVDSLPNAQKKPEGNLNEQGQSQ